MSQPINDEAVAEEEEEEVETKNGEQKCADKPWIKYLIGLAVAFVLIIIIIVILVFFVSPKGEQKCTDTPWIKYLIGLAVASVLIIIIIVILVFFVSPKGERSCADKPWMKYLIGFAVASAIIIIIIVVVFCILFKGPNLREVDYNHGTAKASGFHRSYFPKLAFDNGDNYLAVTTLPSLVWFEFNASFVPARVSFMTCCSNYGAGVGPAKWQYVGSNGCRGKCTKDSTWTVLCEKDLSSSGNRLTSREAIKSCDVSPKFKDLKLSFSCLGVKILDSGQSDCVLPRGIKMWKYGVSSKDERATEDVGSRIISSSSSSSSRASASTPTTPGIEFLKPPTPTTPEVEIRTPLSPTRTLTATPTATTIPTV